MSVWDIGNYEWSEAFIWIPAVAALIVGFFLLAIYLTTRKKHHLLWGFGFLGIFVFFYEMLDFVIISRTGSVESGSGTYELLVGGLDTTMFGIFVSLLLLLIPGLIAAGLCYHKDKKLGLYYLWFIVVLTVLYLLFRLEPNTALITQYDPITEEFEVGGLTNKIAAILILLVHLSSGAIIIALPLMSEGTLWPRIVTAVGGGLMLTINLLLWLITLMESLGKPFGYNTVDFILMVYPFFVIIWVTCLIYGVIGTKEYGFEIPHLKFGEE